MSECAGQPIVDEGPEGVSPDLSALVFNPIAGQGLTHQAIHRLAAAIEVGLLAEGERLPTERELSDRLNISTMTLRDALAELREAGYLETRRGRAGGTFVIRPPESSAIHAASRVPGFDANYLPELIDHRRAITAQASALAAERATPDDIEQLAREREAVERATDHLDYIRRDTRFHLSVASASGSQRILKEQTALEMEANGASFASGRAPTRNQIKALHEDHASIVYAIAARDPEGAWVAASAHVNRGLDILNAMWNRENEFNALGDTEPADFFSLSGNAEEDDAGDLPDAIGDPAAILEVVFARIGSGGLARQAADRLIAGIRLGLLRSGDRLPPESELSRMFGISVLTLREALALLRQAKCIETLRGAGGGTFVRRPPPPPTAGERRMIRRSLNSDSLSELTDLRSAVSGEAAALAALRATPTEIDNLQKAAHNMLAVRRPPLFRQLDAAFHIQIGSASHCTRLVTAEMALQSELSDTSDGVGTLIGNALEPFLDETKQEHVELADAIAERDAAKARALAAAHSRSTCTLLLDFLDGRYHL